MKFYFPDSQDVIDPTFDFATERHSVHRVRQRDDIYAHEALSEVPFDGILVSKAIVDGDRGKGAGRYTTPQRARLYRQGVHRFFRLEAQGKRLMAMGDCGAFNYVNEERPPYTIDEVIDFYEGCGFDAGISVDHVVLGFVRDADSTLPGVTSVPEDWEFRRKLTIELAAEFLERCRARGSRFEPVGAAQGWSAKSYADSVRELQAIGYQRIALGGMVALKSQDILACLRAVDDVRRAGTELHLLGVTRTQHILEFGSHGVTGFDSTSPFRQAFKDDKDNYYTLDGAFTAIRVPQVDGNAKLKRRILAGEVAQAEALDCEEQCLSLLREFDADKAGLSDVLDALMRYEALHDGRKSRGESYERTLQAVPWRSCPCDICVSSGIDVVLFRGSERNKRRGFHNLYVFGNRLRRQLVSA